MNYTFYPEAKMELNEAVDYCNDHPQGAVLPIVSKAFAVGVRCCWVFYGLVQPIASSMGWISGLDMKRFQHSCVRWFSIMMRIGPWSMAI